MEQKAMTVRLDPEQAAQLEAVAEVNGSPVSQEIRRAISAYIEERRKDKDFQKRLKTSIERHKEVLEKLAR